MHNELNKALASGSTRLFLEVLETYVAKKGFRQVAEQAGLGRTSIYKVFQEDSKPRFETIHQILQSFDLMIQVTTTEEATKEALKHM